VLAGLQRLLGRNLLCGERQWRLAASNASLQWYDPNGGTRSVGSGVLAGLQRLLGRNGMRPSKSQFSKEFIMKHFYILLVSIVLFHGCGGGGNEENASLPQEEPENVQVDMKKGDDSYTMKVTSGSEEIQLNAKGTGDDSYSMVVKSKEGEMKLVAGQDAKLPDNFPKDIPMYPGVTITFAQTMADNDSFTIQATTPDPLEKVIEFMKKELTTQGWTSNNIIEQTEGETETSALMYLRENRLLNVLLTVDEGKTNLTINTQKQ
jgi:hypothetical protein